MIKGLYSSGRPWRITLTWSLSAIGSPMANNESSITLIRRTCSETFCYLSWCFSIQLLVDELLLSFMSESVYALCPILHKHACKRALLVKLIQRWLRIILWRELDLEQSKIHTLLKLCLEASNYLFWTWLESLGSPQSCEAYVAKSHSPLVDSIKKIVFLKFYRKFRCKCII